MRLLISVLFTVLVLSPSNSAYSQDRLTPGFISSNTEYQKALRNVFWEGYTRGVKARVLVSTKYGPDSMIGVRLKDNTYYIFYLLAESNVWYDSWTDVPCDDSKPNAEAVNPDRLCRQIDASAVSTSILRRDIVEIQPELAKLLINIWKEMMLRSKYEYRLDFSTGGVSFTYSTRIFGLGNVYAHIQNPAKGTYTSTFSSIVRLMRNAIVAESDVQINKAFDEIWKKSDAFMVELLDSGNQITARIEKNRMLRGCEEQYRTIVENTYCWQSFLTNESIPLLFIVVNTNGAYRMELLDITDLSDIKKIHVIPVYKYFRGTSRSDYPPGWYYYPLQPWDITDLQTNSSKRAINIYGFRNFEISDSSVSTHDDTVIIVFEGKPDSAFLHLDIEGSGEWFDVRELFGR